MSEENKAVMRRWFEEVWNRRVDATVDEILAPKSVMHGLGPEPVYGPEGFRPFRAALLDAFPDLQVHVESLVTEGDLAALRYRCTGTHRGDGLGLAATGKPVAFTGMAFARIEGGRAVEVWNNFDQLTMLQQIGAVPGPA